MELLVSRSEPLFPVMASPILGPSLYSSVVRERSLQQAVATPDASSVTQEAVEAILAALHGLLHPTTTSFCSVQWTSRSSLDHFVLVRMQGDLR